MLSIPMDRHWVEAMLQWLAGTRTGTGNSELRSDLNSTIGWTLHTTASWSLGLKQPDKIDQLACDIEVVLFKSDLRGISQINQFLWVQLVSYQALCPAPPNILAAVQPYLGIVASKASMISIIYFPLIALKTTLDPSVQQ